jgi:glycosyltransferase involved in cell wall biosynthesis
VRVLHVIPAVSPKYGGPSEALAPMCQALLRLGIEVQIASTDAEPRGRMKFELASPTTYRNVPAIFFRKQLSEAFKYSPQLARWLNQNVASFDLVHIHGTFSHACLAAATACRHAGIPYIIRPLGNLEDRSLKQKRFRKKVFLNLGGHRMLRGAAAIHYVCENERKRSESALEMNHGVVVPLGINREGGLPPAERENSNGKRPYILVLSRLQPLKGIDVLLNAFLTARENKKLCDWQLMIAGEGSPQYQALLRRIIEDRNGDGAVMLTGWLDEEAKMRALAGASLLALPSHHDAFGLCVLEAIARGIPVVVSPQVGLASEIEAAGAGWVSSVDVEALCQALEDACTNDDERERRGKACETLGRKFDWNNVAEMIVRLYESILSRNKGVRFGSGI